MGNALFRLLIVLGALQTPAFATSTSELGANKIDLLEEYLGVASGGDGSVAAVRVRDQMALKAIVDASESGIRFFRIAISGYGPIAPADVNIPDRDPLLIWRRQPNTFWAATDRMMNDLDAFKIQIVPVFLFNAAQFPSLTSETVRDMITNPSSASRNLAKKFIFEFISRYQGRSTIAFYELTNELNWSADLDSVSDCIIHANRERCAAYGNYSTREMIRFSRDMVSYIKQLDPTHLISSGYTTPRINWSHMYVRPGWLLNGPDWTSDNRNQYLYGVRMVNEPFDIMSVHIYPGALLFGAGPGHEDVTVEEFAHQAEITHKKLFVGEFGEVKGTMTPFMTMMLNKLPDNRIIGGAVWSFEMYKENAHDLSMGPTNRQNLEPETNGSDILNAFRAFSAVPGPISPTPRVVITSPAPCTQVDLRNRVYASASSFDGISHVDFLAGDRLLSSARNAPYSAPYDLPAGVAALTAVAVSNSGHSASMTVNVGVGQAAQCIAESPHDR